MQPKVQEHRHVQVQAQQQKCVQVLANLALATGATLVCGHLSTHLEADQCCEVHVGYALELMVQVDRDEVQQVVLGGHQLIAGKGTKGTAPAAAAAVACWCKTHLVALGSR